MRGFPAAHDRLWDPFLRRCVRSGRPCACTAVRSPNAPPAASARTTTIIGRTSWRRASRWARRLLIGTGVVAFAAVASCGIVWMQLGYGPVAIDVATPWLTSAIEERLGGRHRVEVGGTVLERDEVGRSALRLRDIVVRDAHGTVIASAPKAEVGVSGVSLLTGRVQADRLSLIGAAMALRIDAGGQINLLTGGSETASAGAPTVTSSIAAMAGHAGRPIIAAGRGRDRSARRACSPGSTASTRSGSTAARSPRSG